MEPKNLNIGFTYAKHGGGKMKIMISFKAEEDLLKLLDDYARKHNLSRSEAIRVAILRLIETDKSFPAKVEKIRIK